MHNLMTIQFYKIKYHIIGHVWNIQCWSINSYNTIFQYKYIKFSIKHRLIAVFCYLNLCAATLQTKKIKGNLFMSGIMFYGHNGRIEIPLFTGKIDYFIFIVNGFKIFLSYYFKVRENVCLNIIPG